MTLLKIYIFSIPYFPHSISYGLVLTFGGTYLSLFFIDLSEIIFFLLFLTQVLSKVILESVWKVKEYKEINFQVVFHRFFLNFEVNNNSSEKWDFKNKMFESGLFLEGRPVEGNQEIFSSYSFRNRQKGKFKNIEILLDDEQGML